MMVLLMRLEMIREQQNSLAQDCNLYFWRPAICLVGSVFLDYTLLNFSRQCHTSERYSSSCLNLFLYASEHSTFWRGISECFGESSRPVDSEELAHLGRSELSGKLPRSRYGRDALHRFSHKLT